MQFCHFTPQKIVNVFRNNCCPVHTVHTGILDVVYATLISCHQYNYELLTYYYSMFLHLLGQCSWSVLNLHGSGSRLFVSAGPKFQNIFLFVTCCISKKCPIGCSFPSQIDGAHLQKYSLAAIFSDILKAWIRLPNTNQTIEGLRRRFRSIDSATVLHTGIYFSSLRNVFLTFSLLSSAILKVNEN